ncbi:hypothetical protein ANO11243_084300 [Dothideomycetidae sp. 11243]|nr:hypothetical protein ANO11243_084300 [fungal sp. No.11243]
MPPPTKSAPETAKNSDRNEYIPSFISKKPFYIDDATASQDDYLQHQRLQSQKNLDPIATSQWYDRGRKAAPAATKYRKGACENCGAMTHKAKDCLQRTRKQGARWTGRDIQADEAIQDVKLGWDAKRDRWNGYDASEYQNVIDEFNDLEEMKKKGNKGDGDQDAADEGTKYDEETDMGRQQPTSTRNLRLREDTAKYLLNLDLDSAKYDPKTRTMVDQDPDGLDAEDGFARASGDAAEFERAQRYAWESHEKGDKNALHLQANPTAGEITRKKEEQESKERRDAQKKALLEKYGGEEHLKDDPLKNVAKITENERFVEYDAKGRLKSLADKKEKSMYAEDVYTNNHTAVWGSWWKDFKWGYACCHSTTKNSYCVGEEGRKAIEESAAFTSGDILLPEKDHHAENGISKGENGRPQVTVKRTISDLHAEEGGNDVDEAEAESRKRRAPAVEEVRRQSSLV